MSGIRPGHRRRYRTQTRRARVFLAGCLLLGLVLAALAMLDLPIPAPSENPPAVEDPAEQQGAPEVTEFAAALAPRPVYKYSVVEGGVYTAGELAAAAARDPIVAEHYRGLDVQRASTETVASDRLVYMSYRLDGRIYWTKNKVRLKQGETILTDGRSEVRSRCGNCISLEPMEPTAADEPDLVEFEALTSDLVIPASPSNAVVGMPPGLLLPPPFGDAPSGPAGDPFGPMVVGPVAQMLEDIPSDIINDPGIPDPPFTLDPGFIPPGPPFPVPVPPSSGGQPPGNAPPDDPGRPPVIVTPLPPFEPPIDVPPDFEPEDPGEDPENPVPVPEPGTLVLVGGGLAEMIRRHRARNGQRP